MNPDKAMLACGKQRRWTHDKSR